MSERTTLLLVDDHAVVRSGLRALLEAVAGFEVVGEAAGVADSVEAAARLHPDVVLMDVRLAGGSGIDATRQILASVPSARVLVLTSFGEAEVVADSIAAGAAGYVVKDSPAKDLIEAIRAVASGRSFVDPAVAGPLLERAAAHRRAERDPRLALLSGQERRILELIAEGLTNREIGERLRLSEKTVTNYVTEILAKLEVKRRAEAAAYLTRHSRD